MQINTKSITADNSRRRLWQRVVSTLVCVVVFCTTYALIMPAITISEPVYCNLDEHTHTDECYADGELVCARLEHMHNLSCYSDPNADLETEDDWLADVLNANVLGDSLADVAYVAVSQLGYAESTNNYIVHEDGASVSGYTRFGAWSGDPYAPWNIAFVNFCVYYAGYDYLEGYQPVDDLIEWATVLSQNGILYTPYALPELGQLAIVNEEGTLYLGIVSGRGDNGEVRVIVGDYNGKVAKLEFMPDETNLIGYVGLENILNIEASLDFVDEPVSDGLTASVTVNDGDVNADSNADTIINDDSDPIDNDGESADDSENPNDSDEESEDNDATPNGANDGEEENPADSVPSDDENNTTENTDAPVEGTDSADGENPTVGEPEGNGDTSTVEGSENGETPEENRDNDKPADNEETPTDGQYNADGDVPATADEPAGTDGEATNSIPMNDYITDVSITHKGSGTNGQWDSITNGKVYDNDQFSVHIDYTLPVGTLGNGVNSITYQLPSAIKLFDKKDGIVVDSNKEQVGTYEITENGLITITFFDSYVEKNADTSDQTSGIIKGDISAEIGFNSDSWSEDGKLNIKFNDNEEITIEKYVTTNDDLTVKKTATFDQNTGIITYTVTINSKSGTGQEVILQDNMTNAKYTGGTIKIEKNGQDYNAPQLTDGSSSLYIKLDKMNAGDEYKITYEATIVDGSKPATNVADVSSKKLNGDDLHDTGKPDEDIEYKETYIEKSYKIDANTVDWTITVGYEGMDLSGWKLSDTLNGVPLSEDIQVTMKDSKGNAIEGANKLPYTFKDGVKGPVTVTYTTPLTYLPAASSMSNIATLEKDNKVFTDTENAKKEEQNESFNPLSKKAGTVQKGDMGYDGNYYATVNWTYTVDASKYAIEPTKGPDSNSNYYWYFTDELDWSDQYYTQAQVDDIKAAIKEAMSIAGIDNYKIEFSVHKNKNHDDYVADKFTVYVYETLKQGNSITFNYQSTGNIKQADSLVNFSNLAGINDQQYVGSNAKYYPIVRKQNSTSQGEDTFAYMDLTDKTLKWTFNVAPPEDCTELTITEILPSGLDFNYLNLKLQLAQWEYLNQNVELGKTYYFYDTDNWGGGMYETQQDNITAPYLGSLTISDLIDDNTFTIVPDAVLITYLLENDYDLQFEIGLKLRDDLFDSYVRKDADASNSLSVEKYNNSVTVSYKTNDDEQGEGTANDSAEQTVTNEDTNSYITKKAEKKTDPKTNSDQFNAEVEYTLDINPNAEDIVKGEGNDTITVVDTLSFNNSTRVAITLSSVKVYEIDNDGNSTELDSSNYSYTIPNPTYETNQWNDNCLHKSEFTIYLPDATHLQVVYTYVFTATDQGTDFSVTNVAKITEGGAYGQTDNRVDESVKVPDANASITTRLNIIKVDADNHSTVLSGAEFELYKWHGTENEVTYDHWDYVETVKTKDGEFLFEKLEVNVAYMLVEVNAPEGGYVLDQTRHYFLIYSGQKGVTAPEGFSMSYYIGTDSILRIPNSRQTTTSATAVKKWLDGSENDITSTMPAGTSVKVQLKQVKTVYPTTLDRTTLGSSANVNLTFGVNSQYTNQYKEQISASVGDKIVVTVKVKDSVLGTGGIHTASESETDSNTVTQTDTTSLIPGIMEVTDTANNHLICEEKEKDGDFRVFTYDYLVTGDATLTGWTYVTEDNALANGKLNPENISIDWKLVKRGEFASETETAYEEEVILNSSNDWKCTWDNLPVYELNPTTGKITGYYTYKVEETYVNIPNGDENDYTKTYSTDANGNLVVTNQKIPSTDINIEKQWYDTSGLQLTGDKLNNMPDIEVTLYRAIKGDISSFISSDKPSTGGDSGDSGDSGNESGGDTGGNTGGDSGDSGGDTGGGSTEGGTGTNTLTVNIYKDDALIQTLEFSGLGSGVDLKVCDTFGDKEAVTGTLNNENVSFVSSTGTTGYYNHAWAKDNLPKFYDATISLTTGDNCLNIYNVKSSEDLPVVKFNDINWSLYPDWYIRVESADSSVVSLQSLDDDIIVLADEDDTTTPDTADNYPMAVGTYTLGFDNNWKQTVENLPTTGTVDGKTVEFVYYIQEIEAQDGITYSVSYSTDGRNWEIYPSNSWVSSGTLYVKNAQKGESGEKTSISVHKVWDVRDNSDISPVTVELWRVFTPIKYEEFDYQAYLVYGDGYWPAWDESNSGKIDPDGWDSTAQKYTYDDTSRQYSGRTTYVYSQPNDGSKISENGVFTVKEWNGEDPKTFSYILPGWNGEGSISYTELKEKEGYTLTSIRHYDTNDYDQYGCEGTWWPQVQKYTGNSGSEDVNRMVTRDISQTDLTDDGKLNLSLKWDYADDSYFKGKDIIPKGVIDSAVIIPSAYGQFSGYIVSSATVTLDDTEYKFEENELAMITVGPNYEKKDGESDYKANYDNLNIAFTEALQSLYQRIYNAENATDNQKKTIMFTSTFQIDITLSPVEEKVDNTGKLHTHEGAEVYDKIQLDETGVVIDFTATASSVSNAANSAIWMLYSKGTASDTYADKQFDIWEQYANGYGKDGTFYSGDLPTDDSTALDSAGIGCIVTKENTDQFAELLAKGAEGRIEAYLKTIGGAKYAIVEMNIAGVTSTMTLPLHNLDLSGIYLALTCDYATLTDITVQSRATSLPTESETVQKWDTVTLNGTDDNWEHTWQDLPVYEYKDGTTITGKYTYFVKEVKVGDTELDPLGDFDRIGKFWVEYPAYNPISSGEITITNHDTSVTLPESGGNGTHLYTLCGLALVFGAALTWIYLKRRKGVDAN